MTATTFTASLTAATPPQNLPAPLEALWWDARGDWARAHALVDELETPDAMAVHAYLHRKEGAHSNAEYWYRRAGEAQGNIGSAHKRPTLDAEWASLVDALLKNT